MINAKTLCLWDLILKKPIIILTSLMLLCQQVLAETGSPAQEQKQSAGAQESHTILKVYSIRTPAELFNDFTDRFYKTGQNQSSIYIKSYYNRPLTESEKTVQSAQIAMNNIKTSNAATNPAVEAALKQWQSMEPKLQSVIQKERELNELLDYIKRLKNIAAKQPKSTIISQRQCNKTQPNTYRWPRENCD